MHFSTCSRLGRFPGPGDPGGPPSGRAGSEGGMGFGGIHSPDPAPHPKARGPPHSAGKYLERISLSLSPAAGSCPGPSGPGGGFGRARRALRGCTAFGDIHSLNPAPLTGCWDLRARPVGFTPRVGLLRGQRRRRHRRRRRGGASAASAGRGSVPARVRRPLEAPGRPRGGWSAAQGTGGTTTRAAFLCALTDGDNAVTYCGGWRGAGAGGAGQRPCAAPVHPAPLRASRARETRSLRPRNGTGGKLKFG